MFHQIMTAFAGRNRPNAEYDFALIGPKIGILGIEVKSSPFMQSRHFAAGSSILPDGYKHGLMQLHSADALVYLLEACTGVKTCKLPVHKILFAQSLTKERYTNGFAAWQMVSKIICVERSTQSYNYFMKMQLGNAVRMKKKPPLYAVLRTLLEKYVQGMDLAIYEAYSPILVAIASMRLLQPQGSSQAIQINEEAVSKYKAILKELSRLVHHNPPGEKKRNVLLLGLKPACGMP